MSAHPATYPRPAESAWASTESAVFGNATATYTLEGNSFTYTGDPIAMGVVSVISNDTIETYTQGASFTDSAEVDYIVRYVDDVDNDGVLDAGDETIGTQAADEVGSYFVVALHRDKVTELSGSLAASDWDKPGNEVGNDWAKAAEDGDGIIAKNYKITQRSLEGIEAVDGDNADDTTFTYDTEAQTVRFALNGELVDVDDYTVQYLDADGKQIAAAEVVDAGSYTAVVTGKQEAGYANEQIKVPFTVEKLDLSTAAFFADDTLPGDVSGEGSMVTVDGIELGTLGGVNCVQTAYDINGETFGSGDNANFEKFGTKCPVGGYTFQATAEEGNPNVVGTGTFKVNVVGYVVEPDRFLYDGKQLDTGYGLAGRVFDLSLGQAYDASKVSVVGYNTSDYTVTPATAEAPGEYTAVVAMNVPQDYSVGGRSTADFTIKAGVVDPESVDLVVTYNGLNVNVPTEGINTTYTGSAVVPAITVKCNGTSLAAGADYSVSYADASGNAVDSMVDAGSYTVTIALANGYEFSNGETKLEFDVEIAQRVLQYVWVEQPAVDHNGNNGIPYTGEAITPTVKGAYYDMLGEPTDIELDASWYQLSGLTYKDADAEAYVPADEVLEAGTYVVNITPTAECTNYTWSRDVVKRSFDVIETIWFSDVASDAWYNSTVFDAARFGYMTGIAGTSLFMPENAISRAEVARVFFNMAGQSSDEGTFPTKFSDVEADAWYAQAVSWASQAGIVTGYDDGVTFGTFDNATREQIATMIYRYAKAQGLDVTVSDEAAALAKYSDGASVSDYAKTAMAWCVEQGVFGVDVDSLRPQDFMSRAEMAATAVRVQPEGPKWSPIS